jgi:tetratricopeptide (TPR) repeat protein
MWRAVQDKLATRDLVTAHPEAALIRQEQPGTHLERDAAWGRLVDHAEAHLAVGNLDRAEEVVAEAMGRFRARGDRLLQTELLRVQGMLLARRERWDEAAAALLEAVTLAHRLPYPYHEARSLYELGIVFTRRREPEEASRRFTEALEIFRRLGASKDSQRVEQALAAFEGMPTLSRARAPEV